MNEKYIGENIGNLLPTKEKRDIYRLNCKQLYINYGENVDWQKLKKQVFLCSETEAEIYKKPEKVRYKKGSRPYLEKVLESIIKDGKQEREKVLSIMCFCRDLYKKHISQSILYHSPQNTYKQMFYGGTEEELIKKGEWLCECLGGRLMPALCEIAGISARGVMHIIRGHIVTEAYVDGKWAYFDPRCGMFYLNKYNELCSIRELIENRDIILNQSDYVKSFVSDYWRYEERQNANYNVCFNPNEIQCFCDYSLMDKDEYNFEWKTVDEAIRDGLSDIAREYSRLGSRILKGSAEENDSH